MQVTQKSFYTLECTREEMECLYEALSRMPSREGATNRLYYAVGTALGKPT
jgi:hypothetical protein